MWMMGHPLVGELFGTAWSSESSTRATLVASTPRHAAAAQWPGAQWPRAEGGGGLVADPAADCLAWAQTCVGLLVVHLDQLPARNVLPTRRDPLCQMR